MMDGNANNTMLEANGNVDELKVPLLPTYKSVAASASQLISTSDKATKTLNFKIKNIKCSSCTVDIEAMLEKINGVRNVAVSPLDGRTVVRYLPEWITPKTIKESLENSGFKVEDLTEPDIAACRLKIKGMTCTSCSESAENALLIVDGVKKAVVGLALEEAKVHFDPSITNPNAIIDAIEDAGFGADLLSTSSDVNKVHLKLESVNSPHDWSIVYSSLESAEGVKHVESDLEGIVVTISYDPNRTGPRTLIRCIQEAGQDTKYYHASLHMPSRRRETMQQHKILMYRNQFLWSCLFSVPVFIFSMVLPMFSPYGDWLDFRVHNMLSVAMLLRWALCSPVQFIIGRRFYVGSYHALRRKSANMDVLVALGTNAAYFYSVYVILKASTSVAFEGTDFFETSAMLISFILLGKYLEVVAKGKTSDALAKLTDLAPDTASLLNFDDDGNIISEIDIRTQLIQRNDIIKIVPGAKVPVDGLVIDGKSHVNESMITGEARPVAKRPGDKVFGGTVNENGCLLVKATRVGSDTALSQIVQLVEAAQLTRAPAQKLADKISKFFVPTVVILAFLTWVGWFIPEKLGAYPKSWIPEAMDGFELALQFGISVLVVACPCALGLATPTAVMVATGKGASLGVLIKGGDALEKAHKVKTVVFDKTRTLTFGKPVVVSTVLFSSISMEEFCDMAIAAEANSEHPIAKAVMDHARRLRHRQGRNPEHYSDTKDFEVHPGSGVSIKVGDKIVLAGNKKLLHSFNVSLGASARTYISQAESLAHTCVLVAIDGRLAGAFALSDPAKPEAMHVVSFLHSMGISTIMVTGDNWATATAIAKEVGIDKVFAEVDPLGKADKIKDLQMKGGAVVMVGDGINDSPALAVADVGMAIGAGTNVAIEAADIVLIKSNLEDVITAIDLSKKTMFRIRLNYVWALGYNIIAMPIAAGILFPFVGIRLPPWLAGACMAASSLSVLCSSLLLQSYRKPLQVR